MNESRDEAWAVRGIGGVAIGLSTAARREMIDRDPVGRDGPLALAPMAGMISEASFGSLAG